MDGASFFMRTCAPCGGELDRSDPQLITVTLTRDGKRQDTVYFGSVRARPGVVMPGRDENGGWLWNVG
jgi:hypothetical protein